MTAPVPLCNSGALDAAMRKIGAEMPPRVIAWPLHNVILGERAPAR